MHSLSPTLATLNYYGCNTFSFFFSISNNHHFDHSATIVRYLCVSMLLAIRPPLIKRLLDMGSFTDATILVHAVHPKMRQAVKSLHKC